ncbi:MAG: hypothetical protein NTX01_01805 [Candidatus Omnitrophica bacterium]|nr:hypothetical protein [Candidatus Omnitrophota bacterium]
MFLRNRIVIAFFMPLSMLLTLSSCTINRPGSAITITNTKIASGIDEKLMPIRATNIFPSGTTKVFCWLEWEKAKIGTKIVARWHFVTDNIHILDYEFTIPRKEGFGSVALAMPEKEKLPEGLYKIDLTIGKTVLKSLTFKVG